MQLPTRLCAAVAFVAFPACAGPAGPSPAPPPQVPAEAPSSSGKPPSRVDLGAIKVFDERGNATPCAPVKDPCPAPVMGTGFLDRCRMAGFQVRQCGCDLRCSGDVAAAGKHYDADGQVKECAAARADCTPPQASGAFQDACNERGHRLDVCGCEWLCSGNFRR